MPSCDRCIQKGIKCEYKESKRTPNGQPGQPIETSQPQEKSTRKKKKSKSHSFVLESTNGKDEKNDNEISIEEEGLSKRQVIDFYFSFASDGFPLMNKDDLEKCPSLYSVYLKDIDEERMIIKEDETVDNEKVNKELVALFLGTKAVCEVRCGMMEVSEKTAKLARAAVSRYFDSHESFFVATTYALLAQFEIWNSRITNAKFYLQFPAFYLRNKYLQKPGCDISPTSGEHEVGQCTKCMSIMTKYEKNLENNINWVERCTHSLSSNNGNNTKRTFFDVSYADGGFISEIPRYFTIFTGLKFPTEWISSLNQEVTVSNCFDYLQLLDSIFAFTTRNMRERSNIELIASKTNPTLDLDNNSPSCIFQGDYQYIALYERMLDVVLNGLKIRILTKLGCSGRDRERETIEQAALNITMATQHELFPLFLPYLVPYISAATLVHLRVLKMNIQSYSSSTSTIVSQHRANNWSTLMYYEDILKKDLRAMQIMAKRFKLVSLNYSKLMKEIEDTFENLENLKRSTKPTITEYETSLPQQFLTYRHNPHNQRAHMLHPPSQIQSNNMQQATNFNFNPPQVPQPSASSSTTMQNPGLFSQIIPNNSLPLHMELQSASYFANLMSSHQMAGGPPMSGFDTTSAFGNLLMMQQNPLISNPSLSSSSSANTNTNNNNNNGMESFGGGFGGFGMGGVFDPFLTEEDLDLIFSIQNKEQQQQVNNLSVNQTVSSNNLGDPLQSISQLNSATIHDMIDKHVQQNERR
ncbi:hypothetical protein NAEGRDRAFT_58437 [Naegleria gruberi]|uniref:Uncharacterized protein n=1 Tax=Naegleria gruberi TaxID=5762 RepID=D2VJY7_NAEGR|nr:uncharacterized protein NAEGRDRAFT_58437 [Naegleria gruberi]EFC42773.1 hypothetical protein NAEGRDRAFT_58437 [Naegleria gruberi]|eukprot:XP_002675517.1 hypothetical protein NAEGRDRAFT_58437 [Naegleria gruberi strain NEG-M]